MKEERRPQHGYDCTCSFCEINHNVNAKIWAIVNHKRVAECALARYYKNDRYGKPSWIEARKIRLLGIAQ